MILELAPYRLSLMSDSPLPNLTTAIQDFRRARQRAALELVLARLKGEPLDLLSFDEVRRQLRAVSQSGRQLKEIPLDAIVGSTGRYRDFTRGFLPRRSSDEDRWARVKTAVTSMGGLPPIDVYQIGEAYFVRDGHHRVSIARDLDADSIEAYVTQVKTKIPLEPDADAEDLILKAEYADLLEFTRLDSVRPDADLTLTIPGRYSRLKEQIACRQHMMQERDGRQVPMEEAAAAWYDDTFLPTVKLIRQQGILRDFPGRTEADLYLWITEHRAALEESLGWTVSEVAAVGDLMEQHSRDPERVVARMEDKLLRPLIPNGLETGPPPGDWRRNRIESTAEDRFALDLLVPISGEPQSWIAVEHAIEVAKRETARLFGLHIVSEDSEIVAPEAQAVQTEFEARCRQAGVSGSMAIEVGSVADIICDRARWTDLVVLQLAHPPGPRPLERLSSGFRTILQRCPRPVLAVRRPSSGLARALLAYDGSPKSEEALFIAAYLAGAWDIRLSVITVFEKEGEQPSALKHAREYLEARGVRATYLFQPGPVAETILGTAQTEASDLILMGGYGHSPVLEVVLGSVVDEVLRGTQLPMLICR